MRVRYWAVSGVIATVVVIAAWTTARAVDVPATGQADAATDLKKYALARVAAAQHVLDLLQENERIDRAIPAEHYPAKLGAYRRLFDAKLATAGPEQRSAVATEYRSSCQEILAIMNELHEFGRASPVDLSLCEYAVADASYILAEMKARR